MPKNRWTPLVLSLVLFLPLLAHAGSETYSFTYNPSSGITGNFTYISASGFLSYPMPTLLPVTTSSDIVFFGNMGPAMTFGFISQLSPVLQLGFAGGGVLTSLLS